jgi:uracil phosphoribosyltransferase
MVFNLSESNSIANRFLRELRDREVQNDRMRFRRNLERLGEILAYEVSRKLEYVNQDIHTPMERMTVRELKTDPVLITVLRAGLPFLQGFLNYFDSSETGFVGAYRIEGDLELKIKMDYSSTPSIEDKEVVFIDPMLATGSSLIDAIRISLRNTKPSRVHIASVIAAPEGIARIIEHFEKELSVPFLIWTCAIDKHLDHRYYIVPGLGDAGDLCYGKKYNKG